MLPFETLYFRKSSLKSVPDTPIEHIRVYALIIIIALLKMTSSLMTSFDENGIEPVIVNSWYCLGSSPAHDDAKMFIFLFIYWYHSLKRTIVTYRTTTYRILDHSESSIHQIGSATT